MNRSDESSAADRPPAGRLAAFHYRDFRLFWLSLFVSNIGTGMQMTATGFGAAVIPGLMGVLARQISLEIIPICLLAV